MKIKNTLAAASFTSMLTAAFLFTATLGASQTFAQSAIYDSIPSSLPGNVSSVAFESYLVSEFGDRVQFAAGTPRNLVLLSRL